MSMKNVIEHKCKIYYYIPGSDGYWITPSGAVLRKTEDSIREVAICKNQKGYNRVFFCSNGTKQSHFIHKLVLETFYRRKRLGEECRHLDGDKNNNHMYNLRWGTAKENCADREAHGNTFRGERCVKSKLNNVAVRVIRHLYHKQGVSISQIKKQYKMGYATIKRAILGETWKHLRYGLDHLEA